MNTHDRLSVDSLHHMVVSHCSYSIVNIIQVSISKMYQISNLYLIGRHGRIVLHPLLYDLHHSAKNLWVRRFLDQRGEDNLNEVLSHLHVHHGQPGLYQVQTKHDQLTRD